MKYEDQLLEGLERVKWKGKPTWSTSTNSLSVVTLSQHTMDTTDRELETGLGRSRSLGFGIASSSFSSFSRHGCKFERVCRKLGPTRQVAEFRDGEKERRESESGWCILGVLSVPHCMAGLCCDIASLRQKCDRICNMPETRGWRSCSQTKSAEVSTQEALDASFTYGFRLINTGL